jgi:hypothetical protein
VGRGGGGDPSPIGHRPFDTAGAACSNGGAAGRGPAGGFACPSFKELT